MIKHIIAMLVIMMAITWSMGLYVNDGTRCIIIMTMGSSGWISALRHVMNHHHSHCSRDKDSDTIDIEHDNLLVRSVDILTHPGASVATIG